VDEDAIISLAMCELLLGNPAGALALLEEDERAQQRHLQRQRGQGGTAAGAGGVGLGGATTQGGGGGLCSAYPCGAPSKGAGCLNCSRSANQLIIN